MAVLVAEPMFAQAIPSEDFCHWYVYVGDPLHVPDVTECSTPTRIGPDITGATVLYGAPTLRVGTE